MRGFVWQAVRLGTVVAALLLARFLSPQLALWIEGNFDVAEAGARPLAWFGVLAGTFLAGTLLAHALKEAFAKMKLQSYDRFLGLLFGVAKGGAIVVVTILVLSQLRGATALSDALARSHAARLSAHVVTEVTPLFPESVREDVAEWWAELESKLADPKNLVPK